MPQIIQYSLSTSRSLISSHLQRHFFFVRQHLRIPPDVFGDYHSAYYRGRAWLEWTQEGDLFQNVSVKGSKEVGQWLRKGWKLYPQVIHRAFFTHKHALNKHIWFQFYVFYSLMPIHVSYQSTYGRLVSLSIVLKKNLKASNRQKITLMNLK